MMMIEPIRARGQSIGPSCTDRGMTIPAAINTAEHTRKKAHTRIRSSLTLEAIAVSSPRAATAPAPYGTPRHTHVEMSVTGGTTTMATASR